MSPSLDAASFAELALDLHEGSTSDETLERILEFATKTFDRHAAVALESARGTEHLLKAVDARNLIGQAQGILMERYGLEATPAFTVLRRYSQDNNVKLHVVAQQLIETRSLPR